MIKSNELRLWNWIEANKYSKGRDNNKTVFMQVKWSHLLDGQNGEIPYADPIPLSPEILLAVGFKKNYTDDKDLFYTLKFNDDSYCDLSFISDGNDVSLFPYEGKHFTFKYLHQLQNLYFALTNQELIYNPK